MSRVLQRSRGQESECEAQLKVYVWTAYELRFFSILNRDVYEGHVIIQQSLNINVHK